MKFLKGILINDKPFLRVTRIFIWLLFLIFFMIWGKINFPYVTLKDCLREPRKYNGYTITIGTETTVNKITSRGFYIKYLGKFFYVQGLADNLHVNEFVTLRAKFTSPDRLELVDLRPAKYRRIKILASVLPVIVILLLFLRAYRFHFVKFYFEKI